MRYSLLLLSLAGLLNACNPQGSGQTSLGPPLTKALKTTELAADATKRLEILSSQTDLTNNSLFTAYRPNTTSQWNNGWTRRLGLHRSFLVKAPSRNCHYSATHRFAAHYPLKPGTPDHLS